ncbi:MAG: imidazole glycerol phosphate synthase subunit HisH [Flavobacteriaceae bacterium]
MQVAIVDYGAGNVQSVQFALNRLGVTQSCVTQDPHVIQQADKVIFPGQGAAAAALEKLEKAQLTTVLSSLKQPVLGICLGMQLFCTWTEEGDTNGLGIFPMRVSRFPAEVKHPQMGWNRVSQLRSDLFKGIEEDAYMYLVHSYFVPLSDYSVASATYGLAYSVAIQKDNFYGVQFHPEKSGAVGHQLLQNFLNI